MDFAAVQKQLTDLPSTFLRPTVPFTQFLDALTAELNRDTNAVDGIDAQVATFTGAQFGWLDLWGLLFGIPRQFNKADQLYSTQIAYVVMAGAGPPVAIATYIQVVWQIDVTVSESFPALGYSISFPGSVSSATIALILASLNRIRPAGVPIRAVNNASIGTFIESINFVDAPRVTGAYLPSNVGGSAVGGLGAATNNSAPILPELFLTDTTLNPGI